MNYTLEREQQLNCGLEEAWKFFSSPMNLEKITPEEMRFEVLSDVGNMEIYKGMTIDYYVRPLLGIRLKWQTEITEVDHLKSFVDFQKKGPYKLWKHYHEFVENESGVLMRDRVEYSLPFGVLGRMMHSLIVRRKLKRIFDYRFNVLEKLFTEKL